MSRRSLTKSRLLVEKPRQLGRNFLGVRFASQHCSVRLLSTLGVCGVLTSGCLVTDQIIPPEGPSGPPVIISDPPPATQIRLNAMDELRIKLRVRDENTTELLRVRYQLESVGLPEDRLDFPCPENVIAGTGPLIREEFPLTISGTKFPRNACTKLTVAISANFFSCKNLPPELWSRTTFQEDDEGHRALAVYYIWEDSADPLVNPESALRVVSTCDSIKAMSEMTRSVSTP